MDWNVTHNISTGVAEGARDARLDAAAHQFEASMMSELMKPLMENSLFDEDDPSAMVDSGSGGSNALMNFASESLAGSLSEHGGLGIARQIISHLRAEPGGDAARGSKKLIKNPEDVPIG